MKPRDPRRILHNNIAKTNGITQLDSQGSKDHLTNNKQHLERHQTALFPNQQGVLLPNMTWSSIANSKTIDPVSNSQLAATALVAPAHQASSSNRSDPRLIVGQNGSNPDEATNAAPATTLAGQPVDPYGAVDHLLGGYDEQQKSLIQKERARRIEEQRELFRARKLCLVLDLDHTLLNSAKVLMVYVPCYFKLCNSLQIPLMYCILVQFGEVDPIHDEILRKKEEQDRCFQDRHLYRLQHMAMWTKLRPGIWNFLRKVCSV
jgi:RNA polymerase II C-terminal domain phosphatase-like 3/4